VEEVHVDNERDVFTLRSEAERGPWAIEEGGTHAYTCDAKLEDTKLEVENLGDGRLDDEALNDAELDDADLTHMYTHVSELADDTDDAKDEELADGDDSDELDECMDADLTHAMVNNGDGDNDEVENNELEEVMDADLMPARISKLGDDDDIPDDLMRVKRYLSMLERPDGMTDRAFGALRRYATEFLIHEGLLFRRSKPNMPPKRVIWDKSEQISIIQQMHDESGHRGKKGTYQKIALRYWWKGHYRDVERWITTCESCQKRSPIRVTEELHPTLDNAL